MHNFSRQGIAAVFVFALMTFVRVPAFAQVDFSGEWTPNGNEDSIGNPYVGDWLGIPMSDASRARAEAWAASVQTLPEWQCRPHGFAYIYRGPSQLRITKEVDPVTRQVTAFHAEWLRSVDNIYYLDGRPHPSANAPHTWGGFATAKWDGDILTVTVTHLKEGYVRLNGVPRSDLATVTEHWIRHGNWLTVVTIVEDPVYLTEPFVRSTDYELDQHQLVAPYPCDVVEEVERGKNVVPHFLPGTNPSLKDFAAAHNLPEEATRGGAATMYPEYRSKLATMPTVGKK